MCLCVCLWLLWGRVGEDARVRAVEGREECICVCVCVCVCVCAERTVALLAFEKPQSSPLGDLMGVAHRHKTATELNSAILLSKVRGHAAVRARKKHTHTRKSARAHTHTHTHKCVP